jgi:hypothetical protein
MLRLAAAKFNRESRRAPARRARAFVASAFGLFPVFWINALMMAAGGWLTRPGADRKAG